MSSPGLSSLNNSGSAVSGVGGASVGMGSGSMNNSVVTGIGGTAMLPNACSSSSSKSSTSSSHHNHMLNAAVVVNVGGGQNSQCSTNGTNNNNSSSLSQAMLHPNINSGITGNGITTLLGTNCGAGGPQQASPHAPPTYVDLRKKKCIRYMASIYTSSNDCNKHDRYNDLEYADGQHTDDEEHDDNQHDNIGSCDSGEDIHKTRDDDSMSSPGSLSGLSNLQSPSTSLASSISLIANSAISQHVSGLMNSAVSELQLQHHQHHMKVLQAQQQHLNQHLLHQTKVHRHHQQRSSHLQQSNDLSSSTSNTIPTKTSAYEGRESNTTTNEGSTLFPTPSTSSSSSTGSVSFSESVSSSSTTTSFTSSSASISDRMVRSLYSSSPAMLLGNHIGHIAIGLDMNHNNIHHNSIINDNTYNPLGQSKNTYDGHNLTVPLVVIASTRNRASTTSLNTLRHVDLDKTIHSTTLTLSPSIYSAGSEASSPDDETLCTNITSNINISGIQLSIPIQRNPIGANPRDNNNPLSINQLTKRSHEESNSFSGSIKTPCTASSIIFSTTPSTAAILEVNGHKTTIANVGLNHLHAANHVIKPALPSHNAMFRNNFFHKQFGHHLVTATAAVVAKASASMKMTQTMRIADNSKNNENDVTKSALAVNIDVGRRPANDTTTANESGAISVT